jgi:hypothetical protein
MSRPLLLFVALCGVLSVVSAEHSRLLHRDLADAGHRDLEDYVVPEHKPTSAVKALNGYGSGVAVFDGKKTNNAIFSGAVMTGILGAGMLVLWMLFLLLQNCVCLKKTICKCCCCFWASFSPKHRSRSKIFITFMFLLVCILMLTSIKGRDSFHKGVDSVAKTMGMVETAFTSLDTSAGQMQTQGSTLGTDVPQLMCECGVTDDEKAACQNSPQAQQEFDDAFEEQKSGMQAGVEAYGAVGGVLKALTEPAVKMAQNFKKLFATQFKMAIDMLIGAVVAFAMLVCLFGMVSAWCLSKNSQNERKGCARLIPCKISSLLFGLTNLFGFVFLLLCLICVVVEASMSIYMADICAGVPEQNMILAVNDIRKQLGSTGKLDTAMADFFFTCQGTNPVAENFDRGKMEMKNVQKFIANMSTSMDCTGLIPINATIAAAVGTLGNLQAQVGCGSINPIVLQFTRSAICTHMVDGLYYLWPVQCVSGVLLLIALVMLSMVRLSFYPNPIVGVHPEAELIEVGGSDNEVVNFTGGQGAEGDEVTNWRSSSATSTPTGDPGALAIANMDFDGNGAIDATELAAATGVAPEQAAQQIAGADYDGDGQLTAEEINYAAELNAEEISSMPTAPANY